MKAQSRIQRLSLPTRRPSGPAPARRKGRAWLASLAVLSLATGTWLAACAREQLSPQVLQVKADLQVLRDAVTRYKAANRGQAPSSLDELVSSGAAGQATFSEGLPRDPWQNPYVYRLGEEGSYNVLSLGRDGMEGGYGEDADVDLEMLRRGSI